MPRITTQITTHNDPGLMAPAGHYSHVCIGGGLAHLAGQLPVRPDGTPMSGEPFEAQARQVLANVESCLRSVGLGPESLLQVRVYVTDIGDWPVFNRVYAEWLGPHRPARSVAGIAQLHYGLALEVEAVALAGPVA